MKVTPVVAAIGIVLVLVLAGVITSGLILAREQAPSPGPGAAAALPNIAGTPEPTLAPPATTETEHLAMPEPGPKLGPVTQEERPYQVTEGSTGPLSQLEGASEGTVYTWYDGDEERRVVLQPSHEPLGTAPDQAEAALRDDGLPGKQELDSATRPQSAIGDEQPVFRSESGGELMALPGGIILALDPQLDEAAVAKFFSDNGISRDRATEIDYLDNGFFVETEPGLPSLELANSLAGLEGVILSTPNWAREVELK